MTNMPKTRTLATPHDETLTATLNDILSNDEWTVMASVMGIGATHCLAMKEPDGSPESGHNISCVYYVMLESGSMNGISSYMSATREFPIYRVTDGNIFPLTHLLVEVAHDEYLLEIS